MRGPQFLIRFLGILLPVVGVVAVGSWAIEPPRAAAPAMVAEEAVLPTASPTIELQATASRATAPVPIAPVPTATAPTVMPTPMSPQPVAVRTSKTSAPMGGPLQDTMVCYYGNRAANTMGILGQFPLEQLLVKLRALAKDYDALNGERGVQPCFDYIYLVADASRQPYAHYTPRLDLFEEAMRFAEERNILFFVDLQLGYRTIDEELPQLVEYLRKPNVHLALDTEFYMHRRGGVPADTIGSMDAEDVNHAGALLQRLITKEGLGEKIMMVYHFDPIMLTNKERLNVNLPDVRLLINVDGVGYSGNDGKIHDYLTFSEEPHEAMGIKLFLAWDAPLLAPAEVMALEPQPDQIVYQ